METNNLEEQGGKKEAGGSRIGRILRWLPLTLIVLLGIGLLVLFLMGGLARITTWYLLQLIPPLLGLVTLIGVGLYALIRRRVSKPIIITGVAALLALSPAVLIVSPIAYLASLESTNPAATVRLPADASLLVAWGGDSLETNYHAATPDQRWAYDLVVAPYFLENAALEEYGCYGMPVVAPAAGLVIAAHDGEPDETPGAVSNNIQAPTGNFVALQLEQTGTYLVIAHLKPDTIAVNVGETVVEGQQIGQCGNSGNTSEPHIHIHHQRQDPTEFPINFAEGLPLYFRDHDGQPMPTGGIEVQDETVVPLGDVVIHVGSPGR